MRGRRQTPVQQLAESGETTLSAGIKPRDMQASLRISTARTTQTPNMSWRMPGVTARKFQQGNAICIPRLVSFTRLGAGSMESVFIPASCLLIRFRNRGARGRLFSKLQLEAATVPIPSDISTVPHRPYT